MGGTPLTALNQVPQTRQAGQSQEGGYSSFEQNPSPYQVTPLGGAGSSGFNQSTQSLNQPSLQQSFRQAQYQPIQAQPQQQFQQPIQQPQIQPVQPTQQPIQQPIQQPFQQPIQQPQQIQPLIQPYQQPQAQPIAQQQPQIQPLEPFSKRRIVGGFGERQNQMPLPPRQVFQPIQGPFGNISGFPQRPPLQSNKGTFPAGAPPITPDMLKRIKLIAGAGFPQLPSSQQQSPNLRMMGQ